MIAVIPLCIHLRELALALLHHSLNLNPSAGLSVSYLCFANCEKLNPSNRVQGEGCWVKMRVLMHMDCRPLLLGGREGRVFGWTAGGGTGGQSSGG